MSSNELDSATKPYKLAPVEFLPESYSKLQMYYAGIVDEFLAGSAPIVHVQLQSDRDNAESLATGLAGGLNYRIKERRIAGVKAYIRTGQVYLVREVV